MLLQLLFQKAHPVMFSSSLLYCIMVINCLRETERDKALNEYYLIICNEIGIQYDVHAI